LQGQPTAPQLSDFLEIEQNADAIAPSHSNADQTKGLKAEEFAEFLQRGRDRAADPS
jgi:hypothetical protein